MSPTDKIDLAAIQMLMESTTYEQDVNICIHTNKGDIKLTMFGTKAPKTVTSFLELAKAGYYDNLTFHRVIPNFMIQGGCPLGQGTGGPGYKFEDEFNTELRHDAPGVLSMANAGPGTNGSQFFITHEATPWLNGKHTVFGRIQDEGDLAIVNEIRMGDEILSIDIL